MYKKLLKKYKKPLVKGLLTFIVVIFSIKLIKPAVWYGFGTLVASVILFCELFNDLIIKKTAKKFLSYLKLFIVGGFAAILFFLFNRLVNGWGVLGLIIFVVVVAGYKMYKQREFLGYSKAQLEILMFGFPARKKWREELGFDKEKINQIKKRKK